ncbi:RNA polymerase sigma factor [Algoriphagus machipongonensis]|uniref:RNA polymerase sigma-70 factor, ECF subfamily n=1 Tax=Algoriphagus machipongonensis TaxID=388413 RepID=A3HZG4_9BACT|nr:RNA polymerase sigma factor [Algoriphagus machipongonensis]EAZ80650.1 RNA polymerase sigma-70 factor, ECF subfamily [Algoriphagus machipongonensis]
MHFENDLYYIEKTLAGDRHAFGQLIQKHQNYAYTLAYRILKNSEEAEEATQDSFMKVYDSLKKFERKSKFTTWLYKIVYHEALGRLRKMKNIMIDIDEVTDLKLPVDDFSNGLELLHLQERKDLIKNALDGLKATESAVLTLFYLEEQSIKEIEVITELSESHIKILLHRGRKNMLISLQKFTKKEISHLL